MRKFAVLTATLCLLAMPAWGQAVSARPDAVAIAVYPGEEEAGLVLVTEQRTVTLPAGRSRVSFRGVAAGIVPQTVAVQGLPGGVAEQNFDYNLLTPGALIQASSGNMATLVRTDRATGKTTQERARILASAQGAILDIDGRLEALRCSGVPEKLVLDQLPPGFTDQPTLSVEAVMSRAGTYKLTLSYLALGVSWKANYVARLSEDQKRLGLTSWITIDNRSAAAFPDAPIQVIAGQLERKPGETQGPKAKRWLFQPLCWEVNSGRKGNAYPPPPPPPMVGFNDDDTMLESVVMTARSQAGLPVELLETVQSDLGDYKLYALPEPTTLAPFQTKQILMFSRPEVAVKIIKRATFSHVRNGLTPQPTETESYAADVIQFRNDRASGLGVPLPQGDVAVLRNSGSGELLAGEVEIEDTPTNLPTEFVLAESHLAPVRSQIVRTWTTGGGKGIRYHARVAVTAINADSVPARFEIREEAGFRGFRVAASTRPSTLEQGKPSWTLDVPAHGEAALAYTLEWTAEP